MKGARFQNKRRLTLTGRLNPTPEKPQYLCVPAPAGHPRLDCADVSQIFSTSEQVGIEMYLKPALEATETIYAQKNGKFRDKREVIAWGPRLTALKELFLLHGSYAPRDPKATEQFGIKVVVVKSRHDVSEAVGYVL